MVAARRDWQTMDAFPKNHPHIKIYTENKMTTTFFNAWSRLFNGRRRSVAYSKNLMTYAKTEYGNDWQYAYNYMLENDGKAPKSWHSRKVTVK